MYKENEKPKTCLHVLLSQKPSENSVFFSIESLNFNSFINCPVKGYQKLAGTGIYYHMAKWDKRENRFMLAIIFS